MKPLRLPRGVFTVSLDLEMFWGVRDHRTLANYGENIDNERAVIPRLLELFKRYDIHCTWAAVGFLFFKDKSALLEALPREKPSYRDGSFDPYGYLARTEPDPRRHFAPDLIRQIAAAPGQEIATHTFSHYYCLEDGQTPGQFRADLEQALKVAAERGINIRSIVFPRNQYAKEHLEACRDLGIKTFRGNEPSWGYRTGGNPNSPLRRALRFVDSYVNVSGHHAYGELAIEAGLLNVPSSRFLRPHRPSLRFLDGIKLSRITRAMDHAARNGRLFHLWWHPHNFGAHMVENFLFLEKILAHYRELSSRGLMSSKTMGELCDAAG